MDFFGIIGETFARSGFANLSWQQGVVQQNHVVLVDGVLVDLDSVLAILLGVAFLHSIARQFARLAA